MSQAAASTQEELARRHRVAANTVTAMFTLPVLLLAILAVRIFVSRQSPPTFSELLADVLGTARMGASDPVLTGALWISILVFAVGAIYYRRTKFSAMRLQDIAALRGISGLLDTLQRTTVTVALIGGAIAVMGFVSALLSGSLGDMLRAIIISYVVLAYAYPRRAAWERVAEAAQEGGAGPAPAAKGTTA